MADTWEYLVVHPKWETIKVDGRKKSAWVLRFSKTEVIIDVENILNYYGRKGWELVAAGEWGHGGTVADFGWSYCLKRPLEAGASTSETP